MSRERALSVVPTTFFVLPFVALPATEAAVPLGALVLMLLALSAWRPAAGLVLLTLMLPLSIVVERLMGYQLPAAAIVDACVMAFVAGSSLRLSSGAYGATRLGGPAALMAVVTVTSVIGEVRAMQAVMPGTSVLASMWQFVGSDYWTAFREFDMVRAMFRWLAWLATAVYAERIVGDPASRRLVLGAWLMSGLLGVVLALQRVTEVALERPVAFWVTLSDFWTAYRSSVLQPDVNAAGSRLLLFLVPAVVVGIRQRSWWMLVGVGLPLMVAFGLPRSRAAIAACVVTLCAAALVRTLWDRGGRDGTVVARRRWRAALVLLLGGFVLGGAYLITSRTHARIGNAAQIRLDLLSAGLHAVAHHPVFGVGLADYIPATRRFITSDMVLVRRMSPNGENSHNNFLQIAVELGLPGCLIFVWMMGRGVSGGLPVVARPSPWAEGMALGVVAFLASALFGHPLLLPVVGATFFVAVGVAAGLGGPVRNRAWRESLGWMTAGLYLGSLAWRW